jgi:hypothetical protein
MSPNDKSDDGLDPNPLVSRLLDANAESGVMVLGFIGPSDREEFIRVFPKIHDVSQSIDIAKADILEVVHIPNSELGRVAIWVSRDADLHHHVIEKSEAYSARTRACLESTNRRGLNDVIRGGLKMKVQSMDRDVCTCYYYCDGTRCVPCTC